jgi:hypothetical protein
MRRILRAAGRTARGFLWIVKGLLLVLAVAVLVLWPMSRGKTLYALGTEFTAQMEQLDEAVACIECSDGRIIAWHDTKTIPHKLLTNLLTFRP